MDSTRRGRTGLLHRHSDTMVPQPTPTTRKINPFFQDNVAPVQDIHKPSSRKSNPGRRLPKNWHLLCVRHCCQYCDPDCNSGHHRDEKENRISSAIIQRSGESDGFNAFATSAAVNSTTIFIKYISILLTNYFLDFRFSGSCDQYLVLFFFVD